MLHNSGLWQPDKTKTLRIGLSDEEQEANKEYIMDNLIYSEDTTSFVKRLWNIWGSDFPINYEQIEEDAYGVIKDMIDELDKTLENEDKVFKFKGD